MVPIISQFNFFFFQRRADSLSLIFMGYELMTVFLLPSETSLHYESSFNLKPPSPIIIPIHSAWSIGSLSHPYIRVSGQKCKLLPWRVRFLHCPAPRWFFWPFTPPLPFSTVAVGGIKFIVFPYLCSHHHSPFSSSNFLFCCHIQVTKL